MTEDYHDDIDALVLPIVRHLETMYPKLETRSSCGGHEKPENAQCKKGRFYVDFYAPKTAVKTFVKSMARKITLEHNDLHVSIECIPYDDGGQDDMYFSLQGSLADAYYVFGLGKVKP